MAKIFTLQDFKVIIEPQALLISPFSEIWKLDKTKEKTEAYNQIQYIWFYTDYESPYFEYSDEEKEKLIKQDILQNSKFKVDNLILKGIETYRKLNISPAMEMLEASMEVVTKMKNYFKSVDFTEKDDHGKPVYDIKEVTDTIIKLPKLTESLNQAKELCKNEVTSVNKVRGGASVGMFEN